MVHFESAVGHTKQKQPQREMCQLRIYSKMRRMQGNSLRLDGRLFGGGSTMLEKTDMNKLVMKLADNQFLYRLDDSLMWLFDIETGKHYKLNEPSYFVLSLSDGKRTIAEIRKLFVERYSGSGVSEAELLEDFKSLFEHLVSDNVIAPKKQSKE